MCRALPSAQPTRQPVAAKLRPAHLKDAAITADDAEDALRTREKSHLQENTLKALTISRVHVKHTTLTTQQARMYDTYESFSFSRKRARCVLRVELVFSKEPSNVPSESASTYSS